jgi:hypothetical protein
MTLSRPDLPNNYRTSYPYKLLAKWVYKTYDECWLCNTPVDKELKFPHPMSKSMDHKIPVSRGGDPFDKDNVRLAHLHCNRLRGNGIKRVARRPRQSREW